MFRDAESFNIKLNWDVGKVQNMDEMFLGARSYNSEMANWDVSSVTSMRDFLSGAESFNQPLNSWDVSKLTNMRTMFAGASKFNQPLDDWSTGNAVDMADMFYEATSFNQPLNAWDVGKVTDMNYMFKGATSFHQDLCCWGGKLGNLPPSKVEEMFNGTACEIVNTPNISADPVSPLCYECLESRDSCVILQTSGAITLTRLSLRVFGLAAISLLALVIL